jgi:N-acetylmuramoyl-L-alanine amidase
MGKLRILLLLLFIKSLLFADITLNQLLTQTSAEFSWDPFNSSGSLVIKKREIRFLLNQPYFLFDGSPQWGSALVKTEGTIVMPDETYQLFYRYLMNSDPPSAEDGQYKGSVIILDPGHGGKDWGAYAQWEVDGLTTNLREKNINLDVALRAADLLRQRFPDKEIRLTRSDDHFVTLTERVRIAESYNFSPTEGMVFVSIHTNASLNPRGKGFEIWYLPDDFERQLARENEDELNEVLNTLWQEVFIREGNNLSQFILDNMDIQTQGEMANRGLKQNAWYMLRNQNMASCLIELGFLTNQEDATRLRDTDHLQRSAQAITDGISDFIEYFENRL